MTGVGAREAGLEIVERADLAVQRIVHRTLKNPLLLNSTVGPLVL